MYALFYILAYAALLAFICLAIIKIRDFIVASPLHIRWEIYPIPHEGPKRAAYGGSYMEEPNWWTKPRHVDHWMDIKAMALEIFCLESTYKHNPKLWLRSYPFHMGLYCWMSGAMLVVFAVILRLCGLSAENGFIVFIGNIVNAISLFGAMGIFCGACALIIYRKQNQNGTGYYSSTEQYLNLGSFALFGLLTLAAWVFNPSYFSLAGNFIYNLFTFNFRSLDSGWFVLNMLAGYFVLIWIPVTNMKHLLIKYFLYHNIRWGDKATVWSDRNKKLIEENLQFDVDWDAPHVTEGGKLKNWVGVATSNPADAKGEEK